MKILLIGDANSAHTEKWANALVQKNVIVGLFSLTTPVNTVYLPQVQMFKAGVGERFAANPNTSFKKVSYLGALPHLFRVLREFRPDILHAYYASSYGLLGALSGFHPFLVSVWGSDVMSFPTDSVFNRITLKYNLRSADIIQATSRFLAAATAPYTNKEIEIVPFGVDCRHFSSAAQMPIGEIFTIGCVKNMEPHYGQELLIEALAELCRKYPKKEFKLILAGEGSSKKRLIQLAKHPNVKGKVDFPGYIRQEDLPLLIQSFDVAVYPSFRESFGVSILEAGACSVPVIASEIPGFQETLVDGLTALTFITGDVNMLVERLSDLVENVDHRRKIGTEASRFVKKNYELWSCIERQVVIYQRVLRRNVQ